MYFISHRGNTNGKKNDYENSIDYVLTASKEYNVEIDIWYIKNNFYFGHDEPLYLIDVKFLIKNFDKKKFWFHAKNFEALDKLKILKKANFFWHQNDDYTITNKGFFGLIRKNLLKINLCFARTIYKAEKFNGILGICSDNIVHIRKIITNF